MDDLKRIVAERACERLMMDYCHFVDQGEAARIAELFTKDGVWVTPEITWSSQEEIRAGFLVRQANTGRTSRHICTNVRVDVLDEDRATGTCNYTLWRHDGEKGGPYAPSESPMAIGDYVDEYVRTPDGWRIARRTAEVTFVDRKRV